MVEKISQRSRLTHFDMKYAENGLVCLLVLNLLNVSMKIMFLLFVYNNTG